MFSIFCKEPSITNEPAKFDNLVNDRMSHASTNESKEYQQKMRQQKCDEMFEEYGFLGILLFTMGIVVLVSNIL